MLKYNLIIGLFLLVIPLYSQQSESGIPYSIDYNLSPLRQFDQLPLFSKEMKAKSLEASRLKPAKFAHVFELNYSPENSGVWNTTSDGSRVWRLGIVSTGAYSLNAVFTRFKLLPEVKLYLYSPGYKHILGAFTAKNNIPPEVLAISPVEGDSLIVELNIPSNKQLYGALLLGKVGHDYTGILHSSPLKVGMQGQSGSCNVDINCNEGIAWQREKYAVCKLIINASDLCTGTLINNTAKDKTWYILTANHCIDTAQLASATVVYFDYEHPVCGGQNKWLEKSMAGTELMATTKHLDFSLIRLFWSPPFNYKPYLAGWDRTINPPLSSATIHHPWGDYKKISLDYNAATTGDFGEGYDVNSHWVIGKWEIGTTERGSSGAALFNQKHLIVGDLSGGDASCVLSVNDYFQKISRSWADYPTWKNQLKHWLDPVSSDSMSILGLDPYAEEKASCDTFWNIGGTESRVLLKSGLTWGCYSGHSSAGYTQFAERFDLGGTLKIPGFYIHVANAYNASPLSYITINLWKDGTVPGKLITSRSIYLTDLVKNKANFLEFDSVIFTSGPVYLGYSVNYSASQDTFAVYQADNRGSSGSSSFYVYKDGTWSNISSVTSPQIYSSLAIGLISCSALNGTSVAEAPKIKVFPNPVSSEEFYISGMFSKDARLAIFNTLGRAIPVRFVSGENQIRVYTGSLADGFYIIKLMDGNRVFTSKILIINR